MLKMALPSERDERDTSYNLLAVFFNSVKSRIFINFRYFKAMKDLVAFDQI